MQELPAHLQYCLSRWQRLIPHLKLWGVMGPFFVATFLFSIHAVFDRSGWYALAAISAAWFSRGYILGLVDVLVHPKCEMDIIIEPLGIGFLAGDVRWYIHMDGVLSIQKLLDSVWTISHHNGTVINVPADIMPDACVTHIKEAIAGKWNYLQPFADEHKRKLKATGQE